MGFLAPRSVCGQAKNFILNYSDMEQLVREATCNEPGEPQETLMREISRGAVHWILIFGCNQVSCVPSLSLTDPVALLLAQAPSLRM